MNGMLGCRQVDEWHPWLQTGRQVNYIQYSYLEKRAHWEVGSETNKMISQQIFLMLLNVIILA